MDVLQAYYLHVTMKVRISSGNIVMQHSDNAHEKKSVILRNLIDIYTHKFHYQSFPHLKSLKLNSTKSQVDFQEV